MTINEAKQQINACEQRVNASYDKLRSNARSVGSEAMAAASRATLIKTLAPLIISVIGLFFFKSAAFLAVLLVVAGIVLAFLLHKSAKEAQDRIESHKKNLDGIIDEKPHI